MFRPLTYAVALLGLCLAHGNVHAQWPGGTVLPACNERLLTPVVTEAQASRFVQDPDFVGNALSLVDTRNLPESTTDIVFDPLEHAWFSSREGHLFRYDGTRIWSYALGASAIMDLEMSDDGMLYLATEGLGIVRYDGTAFVALEVPSETPPTNFWQVLLHGDAVIGLSPDAGVVVHGPSSSALYQAEHGLLNNDVVGGTFDTEGNLWVGHWVGGWSRLSTSGISTWTDVGLAAEHQQRFFKPGDPGKAWICTSTGLYELELSDTPVATLAVPQVYAFSALRKPDGWWIGTSRHGIVHVDASTFGTRNPHCWMATEGLNNNRVSALAQDRFGNAWVGFFEPGMGLQMLLPDVVKEWGPERGLPDKNVCDVHVAKDGTLWATYPDNQLARSTNGGVSFETVNLPSSTNANILAMAESPDSTLWFAASEAGVYSYKAGMWKRHPYSFEKTGSRFITSLLWAHGKLWVGGISGLLVLENGELHQLKSPEGTPLCDQTVSGILEDSRGNVWACTGEGTLWCIPYHLAAAEASPQRCAQLDLMPNDTTLLAPVLHDVAETTNEHLWLATEGYGLLGLDLRDAWPLVDGVKHVGIRVEQSPDAGTGATAYALLCDPEGCLWQTSANGLVCWRPKQEAARSVFEAHEPEVYSGWHGLRHTAFDEDAQGAVDSNGHVYFGSRNTVIRTVRAAALPRLPAPVSVVAQALPDGKVADWSGYQGRVKHQQDAQTLRSYLPRYVQYAAMEPWLNLPESPVFSYDQNHLDFELRAVQWGQTDPLRFRYRLTETDEWSPLRTQQLPAFQSLPAGEYRFQVQAADRWGTLGPVAEFAFTIQRPIWATPLFIAISTVLGLLLIYGVYRWRVRVLRRENQVLEEKVTERTEELRQEKQKSDDLLLNILPRSTADELKEHGKARTQHYESCSVLFSDFKGFTSLTETMESAALVALLDRFFQAFDDAAIRYGLEKIKTIGDAYMCAAGIPNPTDQHAARLVAFGLEMLRITDALNTELTAEGLATWPIRIGIHSGPAIAGVVGKNKFAYDVWGDTVNTASRMESSGAPGRVNISAATYDMVAPFFDVEVRGAVAAKNKGDLEMYFVNGFAPDYAQNGDLSQPNTAFARLIRQNVVFEAKM